MKFLLEINLENDAFSEHGGDELCRILSRTGSRFAGHADLIESKDNLGSIHDRNGNSVGFWTFQ